MEFNPHDLSPSLLQLAVNNDKDKKDIQEYYRENSFKNRFKRDLNSSGIKGFIKRLFIIDSDGVDCTTENSCIIGIIFNIILFFIYSITLKLGFNYSFFPLSIVITFGIFLYYNIISRFQGIIINCLVYFLSVFLVNYHTYNASREGLYHPTYVQQVQKDSLNRNQFFIENLQIFNNQKYNLIKYD